jgi:hypothetical protein
MPELFGLSGAAGIPVLSHRSDPVLLNLVRAVVDSAIVEGPRGGRSGWGACFRGGVLGQHRDPALLSAVRGVDDPFERVAPVRSFPSFRGQVNFTPASVSPGIARAPQSPQPSLRDRAVAGWIKASGLFLKG